MPNTPNEVQDKPLELGVKVQSILTSLILMVMAWVGYNIHTTIPNAIDKLREDLVDVKIISLQTAQTTDYLQMQLRQCQQNYAELLNRVQELEKEDARNHNLRNNSHGRNENRNENTSDSRYSSIAHDIISYSIECRSLRWGPALGYAGVSKGSDVAGITPGAYVVGNQNQGR